MIMNKINLKILQDGCQFPKSKDLLLEKLTNIIQIMIIDLLYLLLVVEMVRIFITLW